MSWIDSIRIVTHSYTLRVVAFNDYALGAIASARTSGADVKETATDTFRRSMSVLSSEVARVMLEANVVLARLDALEEKLYNIRTICEQELVVTKAALDELLSQLWTFFGRNKTQLHDLSHQAEILANVEWYRAISVSHVVATTETLSTVEAELSELRDKLSAPELVGDAIPLEVHVASIERSARRINEERLKVRGDFGRNIQDASRVDWFIGRKQKLQLP